MLAGETPLLFPSSTTRSPQWNATSLSLTFDKLIVRNARHLNLDLRALTSHHGASAFHVIRALVGRWYAHDQANAVHAMVLLGHSSLEFTIRKYVGFAASLVRPLPPN